MIWSRTLLALAVVAGLAGCAGASPNTPADTTADATADTTARIAAPSAVPAAPVSEALTPERLETIYLDATAAHLCSVQSRVYPDPSAMAAAFDSRPVYTSLTGAQVEQFQQRVVADPAFAGRLTEKIQQTCGAR